MVKYLYNGDSKTITRYENDKQAWIHAQIALKFSTSLMVFVYDESDLKNLDLTNFKKNF